MKRFHRLTWLLVFTASTAFTSSCSVYMAAKQPDKKDMSVLKEGTPRGNVIAELGSPVHTEVRSDGRMDIYKFVQGYDNSVKAGRAILHGTADVLTLGLWEVVGTPVEGIADGTEVIVEVYYDTSEKVRLAKAVSGGDAIADPPETVDRSKSNEDD